MKIIVGLGNPGRDYAATRHNLGFMAVDEVARRLRVASSRSRFRAEVSEAFDGDDKLVLVKPQTYMNLSGYAVAEAVRWYKIPLTELLVIADDIDLPFQSLRLRARGGSGGHNGLKSLISAVGSQEFARLRIGIGRGRGEATGQVLGRFNPSEAQVLPDIVRDAADCALDWARQGVILAMNQCNRRADADSTTRAPEDAPSK